MSHERTSVDAQKQVDDYSRPNYTAHLYYLEQELRPRAFNSFTCVHSAFAGRQGGIGSSFKTCRYYNDRARNKRDALIEQVEAEKNAWRRISARVAAQGCDGLSIIMYVTLAEISFEMASEYQMVT